jgi:hypothetical protein
MIAAASFGSGIASAHDGALFRNSADPYFTTTLKLLVLGERMKQTKVDRVDHGQGSAPGTEAPGTDRGMVMTRDPVLRGNTP